MAGWWVINNEKFFSKRRGFIKNYVAVVWVMVDNTEALADRLLLTLGR